MSLGQVFLAVLPISYYLENSLDPAYSEFIKYQGTDMKLYPLQKNQLLIPLLVGSLVLVGCSSSDSSPDTADTTAIGDTNMDAETASETDTATDTVTASDSATPTASTIDIDALLTSVGTGSPLSVDNSRDFLPALFAISNADPVRMIQDRFINAYNEVFDVQNGSETGRFVAESTDELSSTFTCPDGGSYTVVDDPVTDGPGVLRHEFIQCLFDGISFDGDVATLEVQFSDTTPTEFVSVDRSGRPFTFVDQQNISYVLDGFYEDTINDRFLWGGMLSIQDGNRTLEVNHTTVNSEGKNSPNEFGLSVPSNVYTSLLAVTGTLTNGRTININTLSGFVRFGNDENFTTGLLIVQDESGGQLTLTAEPSLSTGFTARVDTDGQQDEYIEGWSTVFDFVRQPLNDE